MKHYSTTKFVTIYHVALMLGDLTTLQFNHVILEGYKRCKELMSIDF